MSDAQEKGIFFTAGVIIGALLGAITALLFAPSAGRGWETVDMLGERSQVWKGRAEEAAFRALVASGELSEAVQQSVDRMRLVTREELGRLQETVAELKEEVAEK